MSELPANRRWLRDIPPKRMHRPEKRVPGPYNLFARTNTAQDIMKQEESAKRSLTKQKYIQEALDKFERRNKVKYKWQRKK